jgi:hypothetical protein
MRLIATIAGVLLTSAIALPAARAQERPPADLSSFAVAGSVSPEGGHISINVVGCAKKEEHFLCNFFLRNNAGTNDFRYGGALWATKLVDNFRIDHPLVRGYFVNGLGHRQDVVTLGKNDWIWAVQEFGGPTREVTSVRVVFLGIGNQSVVVSFGEGAGGSTQPAKSP